MTDDEIFLYVVESPNQIAAVFTDQDEAFAFCEDAQWQAIYEELEEMGYSRSEADEGLLAEASFSAGYNGENYEVTEFRYTGAEEFLALNGNYYTFQQLMEIAEQDDEDPEEFDTDLFAIDE